MAKPENDVNLGKEDAEEEAPKKGGMKMIIIAVAMLAIGAGAAAFFLMGGDDKEASDVAAADGVEASAEAEPVESQEAPIYHQVVKDFVTTFEDGNETRYVQLSLQVMSFQQEAINQVEDNLPAVKNGIIMLIGSHTYADLKTNEGKEKLRQEILESIRLAARLKPGQVVEDVLFTGFVLQ